jgi:hypothetical protein
MARLLLIPYILFSCLVAVTTLYLVCEAYHVGPFRDLWIAMDFIRSYFEGCHLTNLFALHGGSHRLAVPRLLFLAEYGVFSGSNVFLMVIGFLVQLSVIALMKRQVAHETHLQKHDRWFLVAVTVLLMLNATQLENFLYTFDVQWLITSAAAFWALACWLPVFRDARDQTPVSLATLFAACLLTAVSLFSSFSGLCVCLVLPFLALSYRLPLQRIAMLLLVVVAVLALYLQGPFAEGGSWKTPDQITPMIVLALLGDLLQRLLLWIALYFGSPLSRWNTVAGGIVSYTSLFFLCWQWWRLLRNEMKDVTGFQRLMLSLALWGMIVGIATGIGRMYFVHTAPEDRYQSIVLMYWLGLLAFMFSRAVQLAVQQGTRGYLYAALLQIIFWTALVIPVAAFHDARTQLHFFDRVNDDDLAIATGQWDYDNIKDTLILGDKWKKTNRVEMHGAFLRERHWGIFARDDVQQLGKTLDAAQIDTVACDGEIYSSRATPAPYHGYRIEGYGVDRVNHRSFEHLVFVDAQNVQVGLARLQRPKDFLLPLTWQNPAASHWLGYTIDLPLQPLTLRVLGVSEASSAKRYCPLASFTVNAAAIPSSPSATATSEPAG